MFSFFFFFRSSNFFFNVQTLPPTQEVLPSVFILPSSISLSPCTDHGDNQQLQQVLNLESNQLHRLPPGMGMLHLRELRCSHNRLEVIDSDLLTPNLQHSIEVCTITRRASGNTSVPVPTTYTYKLLGVR